MIAINLMAAVLETEVVDLDNERACIVALHKARFSLADILEGLDEAQQEARKLRAHMAEDAYAD
jgi:antitoxin component of MazEF toxin-antitoxin module